MNESERNYLLTKLKEECKIFYYKNSLNLNLKNKNPLEMNDKELMVFIDKHRLELTYARVLNECTLKFLTIQNKFKEAKIPEEVLTILDRLMNESPNSYLVGGCTRDIILGEEVKDYDFVTDISYTRLKEVFSEHKFKETGTEFLVFNLNYNATDYEIANFRKDSLTSDGRRPDSVEVGTLDEDCSRRDFSCNNIFWNPKELYITSQSVDDILDRKLRFVGDPEQRLKEDMLRGWRFMRLAKTKNLTPDKDSLRAVRRNWENIYNASNPQRVMLELEKLCLK
jgi:tRNA nucleotidyltransferase/poly(A) polymerase